MGFFRDQEKRLAVRLLSWQLQRMNRPLPPAEDMERLAARLVNDAHHIARSRGRNVIAILKEMVDDMKK